MYAYLITILSLFIFIKISYLKKFLYLICLLIIPYILQISIKEYKIHTLINEHKTHQDVGGNKADQETRKSIINIFSKNYQQEKLAYLLKNNITTERELFKKNSVRIETSGRTEIWARIYNRAILTGKINFWIGNGFQTDRKLLLLDDEPLQYYGSNVSSALLNIFICSGIVGFLIFIYINLKILIRIYQLIFWEKIYLNFNANFSLIISINIMLILYLRCLVENSISYFNLDFLIFLMCVFIIDKRKKII